MSKQYFCIAESEELEFIFNISQDKPYIMVATHDYLKGFDSYSDIDRPVLGLYYYMCSCLEHEYFISTNAEQLSFSAMPVQHYGWVRREALYLVYAIHYDTFIKLCELNSDLLTLCVLHDMSNVYDRLLNYVYIFAYNTRKDNFDGINCWRVLEL